MALHILSFSFLFSAYMSHHCHDEHCDHDHDDLPGAGDQFLLYSRIDRDNVRCMNEAEPGMGKAVIKPWNERLDNTKARGYYRVTDDIPLELIKYTNSFSRVMLMNS